ncbi:MAG: tetraacyldisaccharide 4'-kinase [Vampirovibrionales bacterium]|nr:tetraacyldisaccharide 4'-kinase [Vampirovibrionales bacterium]
MTARRFFENLHHQPLPPWLWPLLPACWVYGLVVRIRCLAYRLGWLKATRLPVPIISVGNLTTGGTGKTPVVIALARYLLDKKKRVLVLSRGYGARNPQAYNRATSAEYGDEAYLIQQAVPEAMVIVGKNRVENARQAISEFTPDVILLDDGYQHLKLARDIDLLLVDAVNGFGNGHLLPLGPLREPLSSLKRASSIVLTKTIAPEPLRQLDKCILRYATAGAFSLPPIHWPFEASGFFSPAVPELLISEAEVQNDTSILLCGIARPSSFLESLSGLGIHIESARQFIFPDHHNYQASDIEKIWQQFPEAKILTTTKDWTKLQRVIPAENWPKVLCLEICPDIKPYHWDQILSPIFEKSLSSI